jgi:hypothetical protein
MRRQAETDADERTLPRRPGVAAILASFALAGAPGPVLLLRPDANCIAAAATSSESIMPAPNRPPQYFGPMSSLDLRLRFIDLSLCFPAGDAPAIAGDPTPLVLVGTPAWDTGQRQVFTGPYGTAYLSPGPRIALTLAGGAKGNTYTILLTWQDSAGQGITLPVYQFVQWDATG